MKVLPKSFAKEAVSNGQGGITTGQDLENGLELSKGWNEESYRRMK